MKIFASSVVILTLGLSPSYAHAQDLSNVPAAVKTQIKERCFAEYPSSYFLQSSSIRSELVGYKDIQRALGGLPPASEAGSAQIKIQSTPAFSLEQPSNFYYRNCSAARAAGVAPIRIGEPGYSRKLDRDGDGVACE